MNRALHVNMQVIPFSCRRPHLLPHKVVWSGLPLAKCQRCGGDPPHFFLVVIKKRIEMTHFHCPESLKNLVSPRRLFNTKQAPECFSTQIAKECIGVR
ncbi:hypothetical protein TNCT_180351 [Trichonephila clavata]|uniref:Uncharacterized protein n=1 Tax=Trichonephila clavata TaxID=2740835 RepID=A0A8X6FMI8_TRICU|nr:hypothetical protein TNCT_180351 [Trichonephila clavata]